MNFSQALHNRFRSNETRIHELSYLFWECTLRCNLKCRHCGSDCIADAKTADMPFEDFLRAIIPLHEKYKRDSITVVMTGGEPLLREDLPRCGRALRESGFRWGIVTNGFAYTADMHARLLAAGMGAITLSLDGMEATHNCLRGNVKSFNMAVRALDLIVFSDRLNYDVVTCVHPGNLGELPALEEFLVSKNVKAWRLFTIAPLGRAKDDAGLLLDPAEVRDLMEFISRARNRNRIDVRFSCEAYVGAYEKKVRDSFFFCRAGINIASVLIDGSISACPNIHRSFVQGNIYSDSFQDVWENRFRLMRDRAWTKTGACSTCDEYRNCNGGAMHLWDEKREGIVRCFNMT